VDNEIRSEAKLGRRELLRAAGLTLAVAGAAAGVPLTEKDKLARIASNSYPMRSLFKTRSGARVNPETEALRKKYGEITLLDFPQFTKDTFPGVHHMDVWSSLFGDFSDSTMFVQNEFDPASASGRKWLDQFAAKIATTGVKCHHVSNNAPRDICELDAARRKQGIAVAKVWLEAGGRG
jgi:hypothetical protein